MLEARPIQAAGTTIFIRESETDTSSDGSRTSTSRTGYTDTASGGFHSSLELLRPEALSDISAKVTARDPGRRDAGPALLLQDMVLNRDGTLEVRNPGSAVNDRFEGKVAIDPGTTDKALNDYGRQFLIALRAGTPVVLPRPAGPGLRHVNCDLLPCASLTYDDGPDAKTTPQLLEILKERNVQATFFMQGKNVATNPALAKQVADAGHAIGNHTYDHPHLTQLPLAGIKNQIDRANTAITSATGTTPSFMRPPYGDVNALVQSSVGMPLLLWSVDSLDWQSKNPGVFVPKVLKDIKPGAVILMHDIHPTTVAGQKELISSLQDRGYHLVTVPQLFQRTPLKSGQVYRSRPNRQ